MMNTMLMDDQYILTCLLDSSRQDLGFKLLIKKYQEKLYWHIRRMVGNHDDTDDVLQNVFIKIFKNVHNFKNNSALYTWIYRIATNECLSFIEKNKHSSLVSSLTFEAEQIKSQGSSAFDEDKTVIILSNAISSLPPKQKIVFNMRYYDEMSYQEISEITSTSVGALKATYHHAVKKIEEYVTSNM